MDTLRVLALFYGLASAQLVSLGIDGAVNLPTLTQACPPVLTITVLPSDYSGIFTNLAGLPTLSVPSLDLALPTLLPSLSLNLPTALPSLDLGLPTLSLNLPTAIPTNLLPSLTLDLPTISLPVSALLPTSLLAGPSPTSVSYTCPENDGQTIFENGLLYVLSCGAQATGDIYEAVTASNFNDCFTACDQVGTLLGALFCTGFSYVPPASGSVNGTCYLQNSVAQDLVYGGPGHAAAVRLLNYILGGNLLPPIFSALPTISLPIPTNFPTITLPPVNLPITSILNGLSSDLAAIPLPTGDLGISSLLNGISSNLAGLPTALPLPTGDLGISSLLNGISSDLAAIPLPTGDLGISSLLNGISSNLAGLPTALPLPTGDLGVSSLLNQLSSNLAGLSTAIPLPTNLPLSSILSGLSSDLANLPLPTGNPLSSLLAEISSELAQIPTTPIIQLPTTPIIQLPTTAIISNPLAGLTTLSLPPLAIPTLSVPLPTSNPLSLSVPSFDLGTLIPTPTAPVSLPSISLPVISLAVPTISVPSISIPVISNPLGGLTTLSISNPLGGISIALPTTNIFPSLPGLPTLIPAASSAASAASSAASLAATASRPTSTPSPAPATPSAPSRPVFSCPADNGLEYLSSANQAFKVQCGTVFNGFDILTALQPNLQACVNSCGSVAGCTAVSYSLGICAYKSAVTTGVGSLIADSAAPLDLSCPAGDGNTYLDYLGGNYQVLCNTTFPAATIINSPVIKRDLAKRAGPNSVAPAVTCSGRCTSLSGCIGVFSSATGLCTFLAALGNAGTGSSSVDSIVMVGKRIVDIVSGTPVTSTSRVTAIPTYTTRTGSAINNAPTFTTTTPVIALPTLPSVGVSLGVTLGVGIGVGGLPGGPAAPTSSGFVSTTRSLVTTVLPVTTITTTSTFTSCNQGNNGFVTCPVISVTNTLLSTGI